MSLKVRVTFWWHTYILVVASINNLIIKQVGEFDWKYTPKKNRITVSGVGCQNFSELVHCCIDPIYECMWCIVIWEYIDIVNTNVP